MCITTLFMERGNFLSFIFVTLSFYFFKGYLFLIGEFHLDTKNTQHNSVV